jgi:phospholipase C
MFLSRPARVGLVGAIMLLPMLSGASATADRDTDAGGTPTSTPIKHVVVIFQENVSFDHYFGTYPNATNPPGEPRFAATGDTPSVNGLDAALLNSTRTPPIPNGWIARNQSPATWTTVTRTSRRPSTVA